MGMGMARASGKDGEEGLLLLLLLLCLGTSQGKGIELDVQH